MMSRKFAFSSLMIVLSVALVGCQGSGTAATPPSVTATASASAAAQLTGAQLRSVLLSQSQLSSRYATGGDAAVDSGTNLEDGAATLQLSGLSCAQLFVGVRQPGFGESAMASNDMVDESDSSEVLRQAVFQFKKADSAHAFFSAIEARLTSCGVITETSGADTLKLSFAAMRAPAGLGQRDFAVGLTGDEDSVTFTSESLVALDGDDVLLLSPALLFGMQLTDPELPDFMGMLIANVRAHG